MIDLNDMRLFAYLVDKGGITGASEALGASKSSLSRRLQSLEESLGVKLAERNTRRFVVTEVGREFYSHCTAMNVAAEVAEEAVHKRLAAPTGLVRLTCPVLLGQQVLAYLIPRFAAKYPDVTVSVSVSNRLVDLAEEGIDVALRVHSEVLPSSDLVARPVCPIRRRLVASPALVGADGVPLEQAERLPALTHVSDLAPERVGEKTPAWRLFHPEHGSTTLTPDVRLKSDDYITLRECAIAGLGMTILPSYISMQAMRSGMLVDVAAGWEPAGATASVLFPRRRAALPAVRALLDFLLEELPPRLA